MQCISNNWSKQNELKIWLTQPSKGVTELCQNTHASKVMSPRRQEYFEYFWMRISLTRQVHIKAEYLNKKISTDCCHDKTDQPGKRENFFQSKFLLQNYCSLIILPHCFYTIILHYERLAQLWSKQLYVRVFPRERIFEAPLNINMLKLYLFFYEWLGFFSHISLNRCLNC